MTLGGIYPGYAAPGGPLDGAAASPGGPPDLPPGPVVSAVLDPVDGSTALLVSYRGPRAAALDPVDGGSAVQVMPAVQFVVALVPLDTGTRLALKRFPTLSGVIDGIPIAMGLRARAGLLVLPADSEADVRDASTNYELDVAAFGDATTRSDDDTPGTTGDPIYGVDA